VEDERIVALFFERSQIDWCTDTLYRDSKGWLNAFGRVSFVTFLWRNKEKFTFDTLLRFRLSLLRQPDRWVRTKV